MVYGQWVREDLMEAEDKCCFDLSPLCYVNADVIHTMLTPCPGCIIIISIFTNWKNTHNAILPKDNDYDNRESQVERFEIPTLSQNP